MPKEKFDRSKPLVNIGEIGRGKHFTSATIAFLNEPERCEALYLEYLIKEYGQQEGTRLFELEKQRAEKYWENLPEIDSTPEPREEGVDHLKNIDYVSTHDTEPVFGKEIWSLKRSGRR